MARPGSKPPASGKPALVVHRNINDARVKREESRRSEALSLRMAGLTYSQIAERLEISETAASELIGRTLEHGNAPEVDELRALENARLDRSQASIWSRVLEGDTQAIDAFLRISQRRARLNGMDAPVRVDLSVSVRQEMESALTALEAVVLNTATTAAGIRPYQVVDSDDDPSDRDSDD